MGFKSFMLHYRRPFIIIVHLLLVIAAYALSFMFRFDFRLPAEYLQTIIKTLLLLVVIKLLIFHYFGLFTGLWRYVNIDDIWRIIKASLLATFIFIIGVIFIPNTFSVPRSVFLLDLILCIGLIGGVRFATRLIRERLRPYTSAKLKRVLVVGAGEAGVMVLREAKHNQNAGMKIVGFVDDSPAKKNLHIHAIGILGTRKDIPDIVKKKNVDEIIIAMPSAPGVVIRDIISLCQIPNIKVKIVPSLHKIMGGDLEIKPRKVGPDDLLGRPAVKIDEKVIETYIKGKRILITGAAGSIGSEITRQISRFFPESVLLFDHNENDLYFLEVELKAKFPKLKFEVIVGDIKDISLLKYVFSKYLPNVVFHAAAHKHVPLMEDNPIAAVKNNILGTRNLLYASSHYKVERFVLISTDKAVNPSSIMGATKRVSEMLLQAKSKRSKTKFITVRFGNVLGSTGSVVPLFNKQIEAGGPVTITHPDVKRYFMSISEAVSLVLQAAAMGKGGEIFILDMGEQIKILDLAKNLITLSGLKIEEDIAIKFTGLRPGEKLFEEVLLNTEKDKVTKNSRIFIAQAGDFDILALRVKVKQLERFSQLMNRKKIIDLVKELIPNYVSPEQ